MQQIVEAVRFLETFPVVPTAPLSSPILTFSRTTVDPVTGVSTLEDPERILLDPARRNVTWTRDLGTASQKTTVLCRGASLLAEGETLDFNDQNGNGLIDEAGFSVCREGNTLAIRLTLSEGPGVATPLTATFTSRVSPRGVDP